MPCVIPSTNTAVMRFPGSLDIQGLRRNTGKYLVDNSERILQWRQYNQNAPKGALLVKEILIK